MYSCMVNPNIEMEWNDYAIIVPSNKGELFENHNNWLKVILPTTVHP